MDYKFKIRLGEDEILTVLVDSVDDCLMLVKFLKNRMLPYSMYTGKYFLQTVYDPTTDRDYS